MTIDDEKFQLSSSEPSFNSQNPEPVLPEFQVLEASAYREAKGIARSSKTLAVRLERLAPMLTQLQEILSVRGRLHHLYRDQNLMPWEDWAIKYVTDTGIDASWASIKRAMSAYQMRNSGTLRSTKAVPTSKLDMQRICYAALAALELADALELERDCDDALTHLRGSGITKDIILKALKRFGVKEVQQSAVNDQATSYDSGSDSHSRRRDTPTNFGNFRPGAWSQITDLADRAMGPAMRAVLNLDDPMLQIECFKKIVSHLARGWVPFDSNLGTIDLSIRFVPKPSPNALSNQREAHGLRNTAEPATPSVLLLTAPGGFAEESL